MYHEVHYRYVHFLAYTSLSILYMMLRFVSLLINTYDDDILITRYAVSSSARLC